MHLVHVRVLMSQECECPGPRNLRDLFRAHCAPEERVDHISIHPGEEGLVTVGFFVTADSMVSAEVVALAVATRVVAGEAALEGARIVGCSGALVPEFYDRLVIGAGHDGRNVRVQDQDTDQS